MPGTISVQNAQGAPTISPDADFGICVIGRSSAFPLSAGQVTPPYSSPSAAVADLGLGDAVDALCQAITVRQTNPAPQGCSFYRTPATTPGSRGTLSATGVLGGAVVTETASTHPLGTYQPVVRVVDDGNAGAGTAIGTAGIILQASLDNGRTWLPASPLGTASTWKVQLPVNGVQTDTGVQYDFGLAVTGTADITNAALYDSSGMGLDGLTLILTVNGVNHTLTFLYSGNALNEAAMLAAIHSTWSTITATAGGSSGKDLVLTDSVAGGTILVGAGTANTALGLTAGTTIGQLKTGDTWSESLTTPPIWADADLYTAGTGAFADIAHSANSYGLLVITEPVASGDFATLTAGLNYLETFNKRPALLARFRDPTGGETDAQYITAFQAFAAANQDARIGVVAGNGWLTDAFRAFRYFRSGLPALLARLQWAPVNPGPYGEKLAKSPAYGGDGPLPDFTLIDDSQNPISQAHDEFVRGGIDGPMAGGTGGGITFCYQRSVGVVGTYISEAPCLYPAGSTVLTLMDARVTNGIQRELYAVAWTMIQGTEIVNGGILDPDAAVAMASKMRDAILAKFSREIANPNDPNLVAVSPAVTVSGPNVSITVSVNDRLFDYLNGIAITLFNIRS